MTQQRDMGGNQRFLLRAQPPLQLPFALDRLLKQGALLAMHDSNWPTQCCVASALSLVVRGHASCNIRRVADVQTFVRTPKDVNPRHIDDDAIARD